MQIDSLFKPSNNFASLPENTEDDFHQFEDNSASYDNPNQNVENWLKNRSNKCQLLQKIAVVGLIMLLIINFRLSWKEQIKLIQLPETLEQVQQPDQSNKIQLPVKHAQPSTNQVQSPPIAQVMQQTEPTPFQNTHQQTPNQVQRQQPTPTHIPEQLSQSTSTQNPHQQQPNPAEIPQQSESTQQISELQNPTNTQQSQLVPQINQKEQSSTIISQTSKKQHFCVVATRNNILSYNANSLLKNFYKFVKNLQKQSYSRWTAYYYYPDDENHRPLLSRMKTHLAQVKLSEKINMIEQYPSHGQNYYDAVNNKCEEDSYVVMLNNEQQFYDENSLSKVSEKLTEEPRIYLIAASVHFNSTSVITPKQEIMKFKRHLFFPQKIINDKPEQMYNNIMTTVRIFKKRYIKNIIPCDLMHLNETIYNNPIAMLFPLLEMKMDNPEGELKMFEKTNQTIIQELPQLVSIYEGILFKSSERNIMKFDDQAKYITLKYGYESISVSVDRARTFLKIDLYRGWTNKDPLRNNTPYNLLLRKDHITKTQKIPKVIHQIWIGTQPMDQFKQAMCQKTKQIYSDYEYYMWTNQNITEENFPLTYEHMQRAYELDKTYEYSRISMVSDFIRFESVYRYGGFYIDTNYEPIKTLDEFRHYPLINSYEVPSSSYNYFSASPFGAEKNSKYLARILTKQSLDSINMYGLSSSVSGPGYFAKCVTTEDLYYNVKMMPADQNCPYISWGFDTRYKLFKCMFPIGQVPEELQKSHRIFTYQNKFDIIYPCDQYGDIYGLDHFYRGASWQKKREKKK